ncbi:MAG: phosphoserine phosphatase SerB [Xanthobacteraceae bacterium]|jgi:phosphoserine phosphatase|nr:phosphoserine phosphatase SerB [Xanthobacteraceae bacterium]
MSHSHVAVLISDPAARALDAGLIDAARDALPGAGEPRILDAGIAAEIPCAAGADIDALRAALAPAPLDLAILPLAGRRKRLFLADMDSTMIGQECIDELADFAGMKPHVAAITERAMRGEIAFEPALRERVALLKDLPLSVVDEVIAERIRLTPGGPELVRTMKANGAYTMLVSGGFTLFTGPISATIGFDAHRSNLLLIDADRFAGTVAEPILGREAKLAALIELRAELGLAVSETLAVGDGANDLAMLHEAGLGVAYHAKPQVAASADVRIDHGDLTALLYLQGYARAEFV